MDLTPNSIRALRADVHREWRDAFDNTPVIYPQLTTQVPSTSSKNDYMWMAALPMMREWVGPRIVQNISSYAYSIENKLWEQTIGVKRDDIEDDNLGILDPLARSFGEAARLHPDDLLVTLLKSGHTQLCWDGQYFFDTDHPISPADAGAGTYSNYFTGRALTPDNYGLTRSTMLSIKGENGRALRVLPDVLLVPPALEATAKRIVENDKDATGAGNPYFGTARVVMLPELAGEDTTWYLLATTRVIKPFVFQTRRPLEFVTKNQISDEVVLIENEVRFYASARYNMGYSLPQLAVKAVA